MKSKQKLELTWIGKENRPKLEPRILLEDPPEPFGKSYHAKQRVTENDIFDNRLIFGDNLLALKALEQEFAGKVKCVFIDPPYNTGSAFTHYDDGVEHSIWLSLMRDRLELIRRLLSEDGSLWITIDDNEAHYLKVLCDEVLGRENFIANVVWQKRYSRENRVIIGNAHDQVLIYAKEGSKLRSAFNKLPVEEKQRKVYKNPNSDPRGPWRGVSLAAQGYRPNQMYTITAPNGKLHKPPAGSCWKVIESKYRELLEGDLIYFGKDGNAAPSRKQYLQDIDGVVPWTWWPHEEAGHTDEAKRESQLLFGTENAFGTPKPERLLSRVIHIATSPGDLVLDSFAGSGTTGAVAHKMGRRWIMVELGEHCHTHIIPRLKKVIDGEDEGGITKAVNWKGGGGFRYYRLAPSLLEVDSFGNPVISKEFNAAMLAEAMCKLMGFTYAPSEEFYWQQGHSTETDFIYVTTQTLTRDHLAALSEEVGRKRSLLVCCSAFRGKPDAFPNLTLKKIPSAVLHKCEWGHDDYSLNVANLPKAPEPEPVPVIAGQRLEPKQARKRKARIDTAPGLFGNVEEGGAE
jgi:adenine-specific DNA-methyltransferase